VECSPLPLGASVPFFSLDDKEALRGRSFRCQVLARLH
jgi:hypothetical protein